jgi:hypothetical protein
MASVTPVNGGFRAQVYIAGKDGTKSLRVSKVLRTKREATNCGAAREAALLAQRDTPPADLHTLEDAMKPYAERVSTKKGGTKEDAILGMSIR